MSGSEFQLIQRYFSEPVQNGRDDLLLGIGDDCAIVAPREQSNLAFSMDTLVSGVHFPQNTPAEAIAHKALAVNLSDLAAMGAEPAWFTLSLTLPDGHDLYFADSSLENTLCKKHQYANQAASEYQKQQQEKWLQQFSGALFSLARKHHIQLIGGDTSHGPLSITIHVTGYLDPHSGLKRSGAKPGDVVAVTGALGAAAMGLNISLQQNKEQYDCLTAAEKKLALQALNFPQPRITEGLLLKTVAHAALDLSDGLISDLSHILKASDVGAELALEAIPLARSLACLTLEQAWGKALTGGDDYELCFTLDQSDWLELKKKHPQFTAIGKIFAEKGLKLKKADGQYYAIHSRGYDHFG